MNAQDAILGGRGDAGGVAGKGFADAERVPLVPNRALPGDGPAGGIRCVLRFDEPRGKGALTAGVATRWRLMPQGFVRPVVIGGAPEGIARCLRGGQIRVRNPGKDIRLERPVQPFQLALGLGMMGASMHGPAIQLHAPDREPGRGRVVRGAPRWPVVAQDRPWSP